MADDTRYDRECLVPCMCGAEGLRRLRSACVVVLGAGGVGCPVIQYLAGSGLGRLVVCDGDTASLSNLHRQTIYTEDDAQEKRLKAEAACAFARALDSSLEAVPVSRVLSRGDIADLLAIEHPVVLVDCTDNVRARYDASDACVAAGVPLLTVSALRSEGQYAWLCRSPVDGSPLPCRRCLSALMGTSQTAATAGVLGPITGAVASMAAVELLRAIAGGREASGLSTGQMVVLRWEHRGPRLTRISLRPCQEDCWCARGGEWPPV